MKQVASYNLLICVALVHITCLAGDFESTEPLDIGNRRTLLIAHNIDLADRIPLGMGDRVHVRGMYEWNELGGLVHWTHHDPHGVEDGGWVRYRTRKYS